MIYKTDEKGLTPVVGILIMTMIVIVLSSFVAILAYDITTKVKSPIFTCFYVKDHSNMITYRTEKIVVIRHIAGDYIKANDIEIIVVTTKYKDILKYNKSKSKWIGSKLVAELTLDTGVKNVIEAGDEITIYERYNVISKPSEINIKIIYKRSLIILDYNILIY